MNNIEDIINYETEKLRKTVSCEEKVSILYNLIIIKNTQNKDTNNYNDIKELIEYYINLIKNGNFGYDEINYSKLNKVISFLKYNEQVSILKYALSSFTREFPEHDNSWFMERINCAEIQDIINRKIYTKYPKALFLYSGKSIWGLFSVCILFIVSVYIVLLPAIYYRFELFKIDYETYNSNFYVNHLLNILSMFCDIENNFKINTSSTWGILMLILGKIAFVLLIVNFIFQKITEKISIK